MNRLEKVQVIVLIEAVSLAWGGGGGGGGPIYTSMKLCFVCTMSLHIYMYIYMQSKNFHH